MLTVNCLCGRVRVSVEKRPDFVQECNCALCAKSGAQWGYYEPAQVTVAGATAHYSREDKDPPSARLHFCATCGSTTHFTLTESAIAKFGNGVLGINLRLADESERTGLELRFPDGKSYSGQGEVTYVRPPRIIGEG